MQGEKQTPDPRRPWLDQSITDHRFRTVEKNTHEQKELPEYDRSIDKLLQYPSGTLFSSEYDEVLKELSH